MVPPEPTAPTRAAPPLDRRAGVLLHPTSLPGSGPCGDLGPAAHEFLDWLAESGCRLWQVLPLNPPGGEGFSPYTSPSAFAVGPHLLSLDLLVEDGLLDAVEAIPPPSAPGAVDVELVQRWKLPLIRTAAERLATGDPDRVAAWAADHPWVEDWALFRALSEEVGLAGWWSFSSELRDRRPDALADARARLHGRVQAAVAEQYLVHRQWGLLHRAARERDILIVGDLPIFVAADGCDTWVHRELFRGRSRHGEWVPDPVTGVPPDYFSPEGQRWGNPHYAWERHAATGYRWWIDRFRALYALVDAVRIDHFRGFAAAWEIPAGAPATEGRWAPGPGAALFEAARAALGDMPVIAEDLGIIDEAVHDLRDRLGLPGMKVLQFAFGGDDHHPFLPHTWTHPNWVVYTGTHDNDTTVGWYRHADERSRHRYRVYTARSGDDVAWDFIRLAWSSVAAWAVAPLQDVLALGSEARMNTPGEPLGNWRWRALGIPWEHAGRLAEMSRAYGRLPPG